MTATGPLAGRTIVVTRPQAQAAPLAEAIAAAGGKPLIFPLLEISPATDPQPLIEAVARLADYALAIFISPNAVDYALPAILARGPWPETLIPAAVGQGTVKVLATHGINGCVAPTERFDSEALLELPALAAERVKGQRIAIFRGDGGRELLADTLRERGATVDCVTCYRRSGPSDGVAPLMSAWRAGQLDALSVSSSEGLRYLVDLLDADGLAFLKQTPLFVPHARIAENARALGLSNILLTEAADAGILAGLVAYNWPA
ncbi:uroporphyrinogen-III synthase [Ferribacterium limneticum]|uniref:uroporphyrinogen-III synthase n=1 Tax=Ferribacterium limneticum TaxID=76259 RepID=UPI001CFBFC6D|nr:uroporphyrinogen-III synthase [Ferribacterium limneticum]UCV27981.1 uroporphyrinogen-III synthase [Ferribacterium limneticum]UCV31898.1 uroporphyrinogen-III synthase [Ferribacterium limneticum]